MDEVRFFTPEEAQAVLPRLRPLLASLREAFHEYRFAKEQADEMERIHGVASLESRGHPDHEEWRRWRVEAEARGRMVQELVDGIGALGADVKDPLLGLVDFYARRRGGEVVLLCFRDDEERLAWWHPLTTGFAGRRPLSEL